MKKILALLCCLFNTTLHAGDGFEAQVWSLLTAHSTTLNSLTAEINNLKSSLQVIKNSIPKSTIHTIGEEYKGGLIFYIDESGQHGLIASKIDINIEGIQWRNGLSGNKITNAKADGIGAGELNTRLIIAQQTIDNQKGIFAALQAAQFQVMADGITPCTTPIPKESVCYSGWYLPSAYELQLLHTNLHRTSLSSFAPELYWSSTEANVNKAWMMDFATGQLTTSSKANTLARVRPITHF